MLLLGFAENSVQLVPDGTLFLHIILIIIMVYVLNKTLFSPINHILEERERRTRGRSGEADKILKQVESSLTRYERSLREARAEGYRLLEQARAAAVQSRQALLSQLHDEIDFSVAEQRRLISEQSERARVVLESDARRIAADISQQILNRPISGV